MFTLKFDRLILSNVKCINRDIKCYKTLKVRSSLQTSRFVSSSLHNTHVTQLDVTMSKRIFKGRVDIFNGITIDSKEENCDIKIFSQCLKESLEQWIKDRKRTIWFRVHIPHAEWIPILTKMEFLYHHAKNEYVMLYRWLPVNEICNVPKYAHTILGIGAFIFHKDTNKILVIKEKYVNEAVWKFPGGYVEPEENLEVAIKREVLEETGIQTDFKCLISFRHGHNYFSDCSDIYMLAYLTPQNSDINICKQEILECRWMTLNELMQYPEMHSDNIISKTIKDFLRNQMGLVLSYITHPITKKQMCLYKIENIDIESIESIE